MRSVILTPIVHNENICIRNHIKHVAWLFLQYRTIDFYYQQVKVEQRFLLIVNINTYTKQVK